MTEVSTIFALLFALFCVLAGGVLAGWYLAASIWRGLMLSENGAAGGK